MHPVKHEHNNERNQKKWYVSISNDIGTIGNGWISGMETLLNNFAVEEATLSGFQFGVVQSLREVPGFLVFLVVFALLFIREHKLVAVSVLIMGLGIAMVGFFPSFPGLIFRTVLMSIGFHYFETLNKSLTLQHFNIKQTQIVFAKLRSYDALINIFVDKNGFTRYWDELAKTPYLFNPTDSIIISYDDTIVGNSKNPLHH